MITSATPRRHTVNISNSDVTLYHRPTKNGDYDAPVVISGIYAEFSRTALEKKYGAGTGYKALIIIDGTKPYSSIEENGFFQVKVGDKIVPDAVSMGIAEAIEAGVKLYDVVDVAEYTVRGVLLTVEVVCA